MNTDDWKLLLNTKEHQCEIEGCDQVAGVIYDMHNEKKHVCFDCYEELYGNYFFFS